MHAKILNADGAVVARMTAPDKDAVLAAVPKGGSWVEVESHERVTVAMLTNGVADQIVRKYADELAGQTVVNGKPFQIVPNGTTLDRLNPAVRKAMAKNNIDQAVGAARGAYLTDAPGQDYIYAVKYQQALSYVAASNPKTADYPYLAVMGKDLAGTAKQVISARQDADTKLAALELVRLNAKAAIEGAPSDVAAIDKVLNDQLAVIAKA